MAQDKQISNLVEKLSRSEEKTLQLFEQLKAEEWRVQVYSDGPGWTVHNLLAHFAESEQSLPKLMKRIIDGEGGVGDNFDIDSHNAKQVAEMSQFESSELLLMFSERRKATVEWVEAMDQEDLTKWGRHPFLGETQIKDMVRLMILHIRIHERDILAALKKVK